MRDLTQVIDTILIEVPTWETRLKRNLTWLKREIPYTAPERMMVNWGFAGGAIDAAIGKTPCLTWHYKVLAIWMVKTPEELDVLFPTPQHKEPNV